MSVPALRRLVKQSLPLDTRIRTPSYARSLRTTLDVVRTLMERTTVEEPIAFFPDASSSNSNPGADDDKSERSEVENGRIMGRVKLGPHAVKELLMDPHLRAQCEDIEDLSEGQLSEYYIALAEGEAMAQRKSRRRKRKEE